MKNLMRVTVLAVVLMLVLTVKTFAMSQSDFVSYVSKAYTINGATFQITSSQKVKLEKYLADHPITESEADQMRAKFDNVIAYIESTGAKSVDAMTKSQKETLLAKANEVAAVVGVNITYNSSDKVLEFYKDGVKITTVALKGGLVQTGSSNYMYVVAPVAAVVLVIGGIVFYKKVRA